MKYRCSTKSYCPCFGIPMTMIYHHEDKIFVFCKILRVIFKLDIATKRMGPWGGRPRERERDMNIRAKLETIYATIKTVHTLQENFLMFDMINPHVSALYGKKVILKKTVPLQFYFKDSCTRKKCYKTAKNTHFFLKMNTRGISQLNLSWGQLKWRPFILGRSENSLVFFWPSWICLLRSILNRINWTSQIITFCLIRVMFSSISQNSIDTDFSLFSFCQLSKWSSFANRLFSLSGTPPPKKKTEEGFRSWLVLKIATDF